MQVNKWQKEQLEEWIPEIHIVHRLNTGGLVHAEKTQNNRRKIAVSGKVVMEGRCISSRIAKIANMLVLCLRDESKLMKMVQFKLCT